MANAARYLPRALRSATAASSLKTNITHQLPHNPRQAVQQPSGRRYASSIPRTAVPNTVFLFYGAATAFAGGAILWTFNANSRSTQAEAPPQQQSPQPPPRDKDAAISAARGRADYQAVYAAIAKKLIEEDDYDDGSYAPVLLRLGWHCSGTYDAATGTGGSNGATMRFNPESNHGANSGLVNARNFLEPVKEQFPWVTYSDLWTLGAVCAVQEMGGPTVPWRPGRSDRDATWCSPDGRLPDGAKDQNHLRAIFGRMGFDDREIVALAGAHAVGRCHADRSGFDGPWTFSPITLTNDYYRLLLDERWNERNWTGPRQFQDDQTKTLMMLPTDMSLVVDQTFKGHVERFAETQDVWFDEFRDALVKLFELGVDFQEGTEGRMELARTE